MKRVVFVCHGNICRSPMLDRVARREGAGMDVEFTSAGVSAEELGNPIDPRAVRVMRAAGYETDDHRAHQISAREIRDADLVIAAETHHLDRMRDQPAPFQRIRPAGQSGRSAARPLVRGLGGFRDHIGRDRTGDAEHPRRGGRRIHPLTAA